MSAKKVLQFSKSSHLNAPNRQICNTSCKNATPFFCGIHYLCTLMFHLQTTKLMDELTRFIAETPLWLTIIFLAVFAAMSIWFLVLLVQALRGK